MKASLRATLASTIGVALFCVAPPLAAQPSASPLTIQGLENFVIAGARSRGMGGTNIASGNDASALFSNPASLARLHTFEIRAGGYFGTTQSEQIQEWVPLKNLPGISLLFEDLTGSIKPPQDTSGNPLPPWEALQQPYDDIGPNWQHSSSAPHPWTVAAALPFTLADVQVTAGLGMSQVIDLEHYYQSNNVLDPYLGHERPYGQWSNATDTLHVKWYQYARSRDGSVLGVTPGVSVTVLKGLVLGASVTMLSGSSEDVETRIERGHLNIAISQGEPDAFMVDTVYYRQTKEGTSSYKGNIFTLGLLFEQPRFSIGFTLKPEMTLSRTWDREVTSIDTTAKSFPVRIDSLTSSSYRESGSDELTFPFAYALGILLRPTDKWAFAFDYEVRNLADVGLTSESSGAPARPWINSKAAWRLGAEYRISDLLALRAGYRQDIQAFAPDGAALFDEPVRGEVYSFGAGFSVGHFFLDAAYEYSVLKYQDIYQSNVNSNTRQRHYFIVEIAYR